MITGSEIYWLTRLGSVRQVCETLFIISVLALTLGMALDWKRPSA